MGARFDTSMISGGESSAEIEIDGEVGETIAYYCAIHPWMTSQLTLVEAQEGTGAAVGGPSLTILQGSSTQGNPAYDPDPMTVTAGDVITVINRDNVLHTATSGTGPSDPEMGRAFDTSIMDAGASATIDTAGLAPGEYGYFCLIHPYMTGKLQVVE
jgi:plastocyanin